ncbi:MULTISPECIES: STAS domain-containing protein [unclassified Streptomyces]|uniref:STAS domain-containing protein n=1 Tax=unclassified Streptomyces TaxID=2593676 RepID=UPI0022519AEB|nr:MULTISPECIES: STAS domain-containing protein [unclassified Streptomyces]MCX4632502.1 STAS domain-containing protein [Streptomyces sp. NBC_01443]WSW49282.1 STAS domain-containing protein [Streptomyces sp. NBC_01001]
MSTASGERFTVEAQSLPGATVLVMAGELDHDTAEPLRQALDATWQDGARLLVDLSRLDFCDSTGLNVLLHGRLVIRQAGGSLELVGLHPPVARMFHITGADRLFRVHTDMEAALAHPRPT